MKTVKISEDQLFLLITLVKNREEFLRSVKNETGVKEANSLKSVLTKVLAGKEE